MKKVEKSNNEAITLKDLYPNLSEEDLTKADENLEQYLDVVLAINERIRNNPDAYALFSACTG